MDVLIIGGGPAGLSAAEVASAAGLAVVVAEAKPSLTRKFLMAGKSGLNLTKDDPAFADAYPGGAWLRPYLEAFGPDAVQDWARGLGQEVFTGSSGRVFPTAMKGSPLLRAWLARLQAQGVEARTRWRWTGWEDGAHLFDTPEGPARITPRATVFACGGASWARLGADGAWTAPFDAAGIARHPFEPSNMGFDVAWSPHMARWSGQPVKAVALHAGAQVVRGEFVVTATGIEGSAVYALSRAIYAGAPLVLDLAPDRSVEVLADALARPRGKATMTSHLRKAAKVEGIHAALLREAGPLPADPAALAARIKSCAVAITGARPMDEAISVAGGVRAAALTPDLMLKSHPGTFCAGEMLDWDAPTGGYLLTACFATGRAAGQGVVRYLA
ncbi:hypothetical protein FHS89_002715 [Rubricella aquisinus]|uniref:TIGR03862 family flavoprotein n=1 Tax=Rubricella aquisinus TaxID=2028108 RepID=A0A840X4B3_9RHOB|nr:TIGR03862 family flavoprotein [Rubricella aquisinus]MBB5516675.1 hypothetical protein [Rubricella aquisinus]